MRSLILVIVFHLSFLIVYSQGDTIKVFPQKQSFESDFGTYYQSDDDNLDWKRHTGNTPTVNTGPDGANTGDYYIYLEANDGLSQWGRIVSSVDLKGLNLAFAEFTFQVKGSGTYNLAPINFEVSTDNGATWDILFSHRSYSSSYTWESSGLISLNNYLGSDVLISINAQTGRRVYGDVAIDDINLYGSVISSGSSSGEGGSLWTDGSNSIYDLGRNIGIGTSNPVNKLSVVGDVGIDGSVRAVDYTATPSVWPDYVFSDQYTVTPLEEIETFVRKNRHLPGVPSEKDVMEKGYSLNETNVLLLEKIEELTLYLIEQNKAVEVLKEKVEKLERK